ncbi:hypothetical protein B0H13DRAFT_2129111 [Mycena leptocephala]|nr:hypothetical protein B0H13DRAFT_2129111 [Mycena leptocephala]
MAYYSSPILATLIPLVRSYTLRKENAFLQKNGSPSSCSSVPQDLSFSVGGWFIRKSHASHFMPKQNQREADAVTLAQTLGKV